MKCPECQNLVQQGSRSCDCGWRDGGVTDKAPPTASDFLFGSMLDARGHMPASCPRDVAGAIDWWQRLLEPRARDEQPLLVPVFGQGKQGNRWDDPYLTRLFFCLRVFIGMPRKYQDAIVRIREQENIFWRGDNWPFFLSDVKETLKMREVGVDVYRTESCMEYGKITGGELMPRADR